MSRHKFRGLLAHLIIANVTSLFLSPQAYSRQIISNSIDSSSQQQPLSKNLEFSPQAQYLWEKYVANVKAEPLQTNCIPRRFSPPKIAKYRGTVILFHGFSACPQQLFELADRLRKEGYEVLLPLNPGHGRLPKNGRDVIDYMPSIDNWERYEELADQMNEIAVNVGGTRIVGGLSIGGALAALATNKFPDLYNRQILFTPLFKLSTSIITSEFQKDTKRSQDRVVDKLVEQVDNLANQRVGWGKVCQEERAANRAGYCEFQIKHIAAVAIFGRYVLGQLKPTKTVTQVVGVEGDVLASSAGIKTAIARLKGKKNVPEQKSFKDKINLFSIFNISQSDTLSESQRTEQILVNACFYQKGVNHSLLSRFDAPKEDKFWIEGLLEQTTMFVTSGKPFDIGGASSETPLQRCKI